MISQKIDVTSDFNTNGKVQLDLSSWDKFLVQIQGPSGQINFGGTNDDGAIDGISDGNAVSATNWQSLGLTNTGTNTVVTSTSTNGIFRGDFLSRFIQLIGSSITVSKMIIELQRIS
jgi:hypothetical protein